MTSEARSLVNIESVDIYAANRDTTAHSIVMRRDPYGYHMMNIVDYLVGNTDRHWGNWGFFADNATNRLTKLYPLMDFNRAFGADDTLEGARCQTKPDANACQFPGSVLYYGRAFFEGGSRMARAKGIKPMAQNKKAFHDYFVEERIECGMELKGTEVKSMRQGRMNLKESFAIVKDGEVLVCGMHISPYEQGNIFNTDPLRQKKLLLHKSQIRHLGQEVGKMGYSLIPLQVYLKDGRFKMELGLCKGKKLHDKRDDIAAKDAQRDIQRALRSRNRGED